jgi:hypothetical protein
VKQTPIKFDISQLIAAGGTFDALTPWQFETPSFNGLIEILERGTATGLVSQLTAGGDTIKQDSGVQAGGTAGVTPSRLNTEPIQGQAIAGGKNRLFVRNPTGGGITYDATVILTPGGSGKGSFGGGGGRTVRVRRRKRR